MSYWSFEECHMIREWIADTVPDFQALFQYHADIQLWDVIGTVAITATVTTDAIRFAIRGAHLPVHWWQRTGESSPFSRVDQAEYPILLTHFEKTIITDGERLVAWPTEPDRQQQSFRGVWQRLNRWLTWRAHHYAPVEEQSVFVNAQLEAGWVAIRYDLVYPYAIINRTAMIASLREDAKWRG